MVRFFFSDGLKLLREIRSAAGKGDLTAIERKAHRLKGTVLYLGAEAASQAIARVEAIAHSGDLSEAADMIRSMETEMKRLAEALRAYAPAAR
jgi:HPt (histidine-containing phosphotransfer) domain-containing protein